MRNEEEAYEKIIEMSRNNDYTTGNLLDFAYFKNNYRLIAIDLSKQSKLMDPQQNSFIGRVLATHGATMFSITEKWEEITFEFLSQSYNNGNTQKLVNLLNSFENEYSKLATTKNGILLTTNQKVIIRITIQ